LEDITSELEGHEGEIVLVDRHRETIENYGEPGVCYLVAPIHTHDEYTREAGILINPGLIDYSVGKLRKEDMGKFLERISAEITVMPKFKLNPMIYGGRALVEKVVKKTEGNINIYQEDLDGQDKSVHDYRGISRYPTTTHIEEFKLIIGNDAALDFLEGVYMEHSKTLGKEIFDYMINSARK